MSSFALTQRIFENAANFELRATSLEAFAPVDDVVHEIHGWFRDLLGEEEEWVQPIRTCLWRIRTTVLCGLLPFDDAELALRSSFASLAERVAQLPPQGARLAALQNKLDVLLGQQENPKRDAVLALLQAAAQEDSPTLGLVTALTWGALPGWSTKVADEVRAAAPQCELIGSRKRLHSKAYDQIVLPSGSRWCPFLYDLYHCARTATLHVVTYASEAAVPPERRSLPRGVSIFRRGDGARDARRPIDDDHQVEESSRLAFWDVARRAAFSDMDQAAPRGRLFLVRARLLVLANNTQVFLQEDSKVIEISDLVDCGAAPGVAKRFPRRAVANLRPGDLIVLRTSGSGDYLIDVADAFMKKDGRSELRENALDWKPVLKQALEDHGADEIAVRLADRGYELSNPAYVWMWTTDLVIRPRSEAVFYELMAILDDLGYQSDRSHLLEMIDSRWRAMKEIIHYHRVAGQTIRQSLLRRLREILRRGTAIEDEYRLTLSGLDAGELAVFRIAAVDTQTVDVPYHQVGILKSTDL